MGNEYRPPAQRIESLLEEREQYIDQQERIRQKRTETELRLLLLMIDERSAEDPHLVREIRDEHVSDGLPSFDTLYEEWKTFGHELDRLYSHQQRVEIDLATHVLDTDETVLADLDEAIETVYTMRAARDNEDDTTPDKQ
ncbi:hypothetical protein [Halocatena pleomorpha]|uniref:Uncharacterized protein n=1 Tax=Halocatena pleomorpha TaxID=1785090 RepID=A0A3P3R9E8_9EURY|nr:hypothetical protein [Halocatena pleomorpha]RRJ30056.1 hypothetical protein EIK79_10745 [Halocatena pleomorpha]